jgi:hypothetical protein
MQIQYSAHVNTFLLRFSADVTQNSKWEFHVQVMKKPKIAPYAVGSLCSFRSMHSSCHVLQLLS